MRNNVYSTQEPNGEFEEFNNAVAGIIVPKSFSILTQDKIEILFI